MSWRRGLLRFWVVGSLAFIGAMAVADSEKIANEIQRANENTSDWSAAVRPFDPTTATIMVPTPCDKSRGAKGEDYELLRGLPGCWYTMPVFRRLYPEYNDIDDRTLSDQLYKLVPGSRGDVDPPWIVLGRMAGTALGVPLAVLAIGALVAWALAGFKRDPAK